MVCAKFGMKGSCYDNEKYKQGQCKSLCPTLCPGDIPTPPCDVPNPLGDIPTPSGDNPTR